MSSERPQTLFKYLSFETARMVLESRKFRWSSPHLFNDIFDVPRELLPNSPPEEVFTKLFTKRLEQMFGADFGERDLGEIVSSVISPAESHVIEAAFAELKGEWEDWVNSLRIFCMAERNDISPMWSHYADNHSGIVLELDFREGSHDMAWQIAKKMGYGQGHYEFVSPDGFASSFIDRQLRGNWFEACYYKEYDWRYEREWRAATVKRDEGDGDFSDWEFAPEAILSLFLGIKLTGRKRQEIIDIAKNKFEGIGIYQTKVLHPIGFQFAKI